MGSGKFFYIDVAQGIKDFLKHEGHGDVCHLKLQITTDGLPVGGLSQLWPLLGRVAKTNVVFLIICYWGKSKPLDSNEYFRAFAHEMASLINNGMLYEGKKTFVSLHSLVCDFPAKSWTLKTKRHSGYFSCPKCVIEGDYIKHHVCFSGTDYGKRTDVGMRTDEYPEYQKGTSILLDIPDSGLVMNVPLDPMHLISNVVKKLFFLFDKGPVLVRLFTKRDMEVLEEYMEDLSFYIPMEFGRKVHDIANYSAWKATQFKLFIIYKGIVIMRVILQKDSPILSQFTKLCLALRFLCLAQKTSLASSYLNEFVNNFLKLYGSEHVTSCIHAVNHIPEDVANLGPLDTFSVYPYGNYLRHQKKKKQSTQCTTHSSSSSIHTLR